MSDEDEDKVQVFRCSDGVPVAVPQELVEIAERPYRAYLAKQRGLTWEQVATAEGYATPLAAANDVKRYLDEGVSLIDTFTRKQLVEMQYSRLDALLQAVWAACVTEHHAPSINTALGIISTQNKLLRLEQDIRDPAEGKGRRAVVVPPDETGYVAELQSASEE